MKFDGCGVSDSVGVSHSFLIWIVKMILAALWWNWKSLTSNASGVRKQDCVASLICHEKLTPSWQVWLCAWCLWEASELIMTSTSLHSTATYLRWLSMHWNGIRWCTSRYHDIIQKIYLCPGIWASQGVLYSNNPRKGITSSPQPDMCKHI